MEGGEKKRGKDSTLSPRGGSGSRRSSACEKPPAGDKPSPSEGEYNNIRKVALPVLKAEELKPASREGRVLYDQALQNFRPYALFTGREPWLKS
jgi:hypothetical protein